MKIQLHIKNTTAILAACILLVAASATALQPNKNARAVKKDKICKIKIAEADAQKYYEYTRNWNNYANREDLGRAIANDEYFEWLIDKYCAPASRKINDKDGIILRSFNDAQVNWQERIITCPCSQVRQNAR
ncbi:MAG: hypothetical protein LBB23_02990 [Rickettsiales bacterium]|jgi:hypothetical protein|nr:hypothetical protein [Rickettsiales bacterium]